MTLIAASAYPLKIPGALLVAVGQPITPASSTQSIVTSNDGNFWALRTHPTVSQPRHAIRTSTHFIVGGLSGGLITSSDSLGASWAAASTANASLPAGDRFIMFWSEELNALVTAVNVSSTTRILSTNSAASTAFSVIANNANFGPSALTGLAYNGTLWVGSSSSVANAIVTWPSGITSTPFLENNYFGGGTATNHITTATVAHHVATDELVFFGPKIIGGSGTQRSGAVNAIMSPDGSAIRSWNPVIRRAAKNAAGTIAVFVGGQEDGLNGVLYYCTDPTGIKIMRVDDGTYDAFNDVVFAGSLFYAVGNTGVMLTSSDGQIWTPNPIDGYSGNIYSIVHNGSIFVVGVDGGVYVSSDGSSWTFHSTGIAGEQRVIWNGSGAFAAYGRAVNTIYTSTNGTSWTHRNGANANVFVPGIAGAGANGVFMIAADVTNSVRRRILRSTDGGASWANSDTTATDGIISCISHNFTGTTHVWTAATRVRNQTIQSTGTTSPTAFSDRDCSTGVGYAVLYCFGRWIQARNTATNYVTTTNNVNLVSGPYFGTAVGTASSAQSAVYDSRSGSIDKATWDPSLSAYLVCGSNGFLGTFSVDKGLYPVYQDISPTTYMASFAGINGRYVAVTQTGAKIMYTDNLVDVYESDYSQNTSMGNMVAIAATSA